MSNRLAEVPDQSAKSLDRLSGLVLDEALIVVRGLPALQREAISFCSHSRLDNKTHEPEPMRPSVADTSRTAIFLRERGLVCPCQLGKLSIPPDQLTHHVPSSSS